MQALSVHLQGTKCAFNGVEFLSTGGEVFVYKGGVLIHWGGGTECSLTVGGVLNYMDRVCTYGG